ncbi:rna m5u methyltransferase [Reticulomyxa filosa]|uniref:Rna m5u methyltransferase n=1 Tax=Reticulomyxa filosa TaxID=46433 RepID=X6NHS9_RETFI|nr:rna m5u methyltransferase [Reticulomyxa filosa]|eukprot:ETO25453.1 rna m5u methyltransferase [Reticulomyxa filosa]
MKQNKRETCGYTLNGVCIQVHNGMNDTGGVSDAITVLDGVSYIHERMCDLEFRVSLHSFFQVNVMAAERLYDLVANFIACQSRVTLFGKSFLSGYTFICCHKKIWKCCCYYICCGTGGIGLCIAKKAYPHVTKLIGLEIVEDAVKDAKFNAELNGITTAEFIAGPAEKTLTDVLTRLNEENNTEDKVAIVNPPRSGLHSSVLHRLRDEDIDKIVYVSCNPKSCMSDVLRLCLPLSSRQSGIPFKPVYAVACDLFPHTEHVEMVVCLVKCSDEDLDWCKLKETGKFKKSRFIQNKIQEAIQKEAKSI